MRNVGSWRESFCNSCTSVCLSLNARLRTARRRRKEKNVNTQGSEIEGTRDLVGSTMRKDIRLFRAIGIMIAIGLILSVDHGMTGMTESMTGTGLTATVTMIVAIAEIGIAACQLCRVLRRRRLLLRQTSLRNHRHRHQPLVAHLLQERRT